MNARTAKSRLKQDAVYWANPVNDGYGGYTYDEPVAVKCLWLNRNEKFVSSAAEELVSRAIVMVDQTMAPKGMLALIDFTDLTSSMEPEDNGAYEIKAITDGPDFKGTSILKRVYL